MKYYSEVLNKNFDTVEDLKAAEKAEENRLVEKAKAGRSNQNNGGGLSELFCCSRRQR